MRLKIAGIEQEIDFEKNINILEIEDKKFLNTFLMELNEIINEGTDTENIILYEGDKSLKICNNAMLIFDIFNIDFNSKLIQNKLYSKVSEIMLFDNEIDAQYENLVQSLISYIKEKINELPFEYELSSTICIKDLLKNLNLKINKDKYYLLEEKIMFLIDIVSEFQIVPILIFSNVKSYLNNDTIEEIYKYAMYKNIKLFLIEYGNSDNKLKYENKLYIDKDFDDFEIKE